MIHILRLAVLLNNRFLTNKQKLGISVTEMIWGRWNPAQGSKIAQYPASTTSVRVSEGPTQLYLLLWKLGPYRELYIGRAFISRISGTDQKASSDLDLEMLP